MPLYKYATFGRVDILKNEHIRFTQPSAFNDPFELFPFFQSIAPEKDIEQFIENHKLDDNEINQMLEESWNNEQKKYPGLNIPYSNVRHLMRGSLEHLQPLMYEFLRNFMGMKGKPFRNIAITSVMNAINSSIGILCLSESPDNILMWSHYSANHTGIVIEFDNQHSFFDQRREENELRGHVKKVRYSKTRPKITIFNPSLSNEENLNIWIRDFFWVKSSDWEYEKEWRMIQVFRDFKGVIQDTMPPTYLFPVPIECINAVIVGCKTETKNVEMFMSLLKSDSKFSHISLKEASIDEEQYILNINGIAM